jgi:hypothetical protein
MPRLTSKFDWLVLIEAFVTPVFQNNIGTTLCGQMLTPDLVRPCLHLGTCRDDVAVYVFKCPVVDRSRL